MSFLNFLPTFHVVEINRSTGLVSGHVLSQYLGNDALTLKTVGANEFLENGLIVGLDNDLTINNFDATTHSQPFLVFVEELNSFMNGLKYYATEVDSNGDVYPRAIGLYVGDTFTTDYFVGTGAGGIYNDEKFAKVVNGKITLQAVADEDTIFAIEESTLPTGEEAVRVTYIGSPIVVA